MGDVVYLNFRRIPTKLSQWFCRDTLVIGNEKYIKVTKQELSQLRLKKLNSREIKSFSGSESIVLYD